MKPENDDRVGRLIVAFLWATFILCILLAIWGSIKAVMK